MEVTRCQLVRYSLLAGVLFAVPIIYVVLGLALTDFILRAAATLFVVALTGAFFFGLSYFMCNKIAFLKSKKDEVLDQKIVLLYAVGILIMGIFYLGLAYVLALEIG